MAQKNLVLEILPRRMLSWCVCTKKRLVGAPEYNYGRGLFMLLKKAGINLNNWHELVHDNTKWRKMVYDI